MSILKEVEIITGKANKASSIFESLSPSFYDIKYNTPSEYIQIYRSAYTEKTKKKDIDMITFRYVLATLLIRENIRPLHFRTKVKFVPNFVSDIMLYTDKHEPISIIVKDKVKKGFIEVDYDAENLRAVHRNAKTYILTLNEKAAETLKTMIEIRCTKVIDKVIAVNTSEFDNFINMLKKLSLTKGGTFNVFESQTIIS